MVAGGMRSDEKVTHVPLRTSLRGIVTRWVTGGLRILLDASSWSDAFREVPQRLLSQVTNISIGGENRLQLTQSVQTYAQHSRKQLARPQGRVGVRMHTSSTRWRQGFGVGLTCTNELDHEGIWIHIA